MKNRRKKGKTGFKFNPQAVKLSTGGKLFENHEIMFLIGLHRML